MKNKIVLLGILVTGLLGLSTNHCLQAVVETKTSCVQVEKPNLFQRTCTHLERFFTSSKKLVSDTVEKSDSLFLQLLFTFLLGILMSLTPCIYPMIPITVGILQTTASKSLARNFFLAFSYTTGIATTYSILGLLAGAGSAPFGMLLGNIWFVLFLVLFLGYMALSMLGLYELRIPRFMQGKGGGSVNGSFVSAFLFGILSGTVASPCLSPGLILLLGIAATVGSKFLGFLYLFVFGLGLGVPLLVVGTFSNSLNLMPRAGYWMIEVKKFFGFMLLSMCFYYLSGVLPFFVVLWLLSGTLILMGALFVAESREPYISKKLAWYRFFMGILLFLATTMVVVIAFQTTRGTQKQAIPEEHLLSYAQARELAQKEHKLMLVDLGASWCTSCTEIKRTIFNNPTVRSALPQVVFVYVDCTNPNDSSCSAIQKKFAVRGFPTVLLISPADEKTVARWDSNITELKPEQFVELVKSYL